MSRRASSYSPLTATENTINFENSPIGRSQARVTAKNATHDALRHEYLAKLGLADKGQSLEDLAGQARGTNQSPMSPEFARLKQDNQAANAWFPDSTPRNLGNNSTMTPSLAALTSPAKVNAPEPPSFAKPSKPQGTVTDIEESPSKPAQVLPDGSRAVMIDPKYQTPGASPVARLKPAASTNNPMLGNDIQQALVGAYPNLGAKDHADNAKFLQAFKQKWSDDYAATGKAPVYDRDHMFNLAESVLGKPASPGLISTTLNNPLVPKPETAMKLPGGTSVTPTANVSAQPSQAPVQAGNVSIGKPDAAPAPFTFDNGVALGRTLSGQSPQQQTQIAAMPPPVTTPAQSRPLASAGNAVGSAVNGFFDNLGSMAGGGIPSAPVKPAPAPATTTATPDYTRATNAEPTTRDARYETLKNSQAALDAQINANNAETVKHANPLDAFIHPSYGLKRMGFNVTTPDEERTSEQRRLMGEDDKLRSQWSDFFHPSQPAAAPPIQFAPSANPDDQLKRLAAQRPVSSGTGFTGF